MDYIKESDTLKALGHPVRLKMVDGLLRNQCNVSKIVKNLKLPQSTVSQHLGILKKAGILFPVKDGVRICYRVVNKKIIEVIKILEK
ncbi:MAG: metalloregulator ArsR/SmtB family transcription factor [Candidatus Omnitrophica bacterium]|nr:metalloregulator ArsR/SmtB family transcription factor [Candidatus Omnitrophota bacterium]